jgi:hypothetical protein
MPEDEYWLVGQANAPVADKQIRRTEETLMADCFETVYVKDRETYYCKVEQLTVEFWQATVLKSPLQTPQDPPVEAYSLEDAKEQAHHALVHKLGLESATTLDLTWRKCPE